MRHAPALLLAAVLVASACTARHRAPDTPADGPVASEPKAAEPGPPRVFAEHGFALRAPGPGYSVLDTAEARRINPDAVAGILGGGGALLVILERSPGLTADDLADLVLEGVRLRDLRIVSREAVVFEGQDAVRTVTTGTTDGVAARLVHIVFVRDGVGHQVVAWGGHPDDVTGEDLAHFFDAVSLLDGTVRLDLDVADIVEAAGAGWRVRDRIFESAATGLVVDPGEAFSVTVGPPLAQMHGEAEVGLISKQGDVHLVVIPERTPPHWFDAYQKAAHENFRQSIGGSPDGSFVTLVVDGKPLRLERIPGLIDQHLGVYCRGDLCVQVQLWYLSGVREEARAILEETPPTLRLMDEAEHEALVASMGRHGRHETVVGESHALRGGVYTHFEVGLRIRLPEVGMWRIRTGQAMATRNPAALVELEEPRMGVHGEVLVEWIDEKTGLRDAARYHAAARAMFDHDGSAEVLARSFGPISAHESRLVTKADAFTWHHRILTAVRGDVGIMISLWGYPETMAAAESAMDALLAGVQIAEGPVETTHASGMRHADLRLGYAVELPGGTWQPIDATPPQIAPIGGMRAWSRTDGPDQALVVAAIYSGAGGEDLGLVTELAGELMPDPPPGLSWQTEDYLPGTLGGRPARCRTAAGRPGRLDVCLLVHGPMMYLATFVAFGAEPADPEAAFASFTLLEGGIDPAVDGARDPD
jgi:hypothetical protein